MSLPHYYSTLAPFRATFRTGHPVLTYHHVGPRPRGVRLKGLFLSQKLFVRQIAELGEAGFSSQPLAAITSSHTDARPLVFLTFDDGFRDVFEHALPVLRQQRCCSIVFLVSEFIGKTNEWQQRAGDIAVPMMDEAQARDWLAAGQEIGSHTRTHPRLTQLSADRAREEIVASKKSLEDRFGRAVDHFCYPYGDWNEAIRDLVQEAGYRTACTTNPGVNLPGTSPFELKRFTARYPSRNLKALLARFGRFWSQGYVKR
jgi:peptidoglycan/xylan/chitin deacetylase (PgdA/CDA1 family)